MATQHFGIVGAGIVGLTLAHRLRRLGHQVTIIESAPEIGGLASAWQIGDVTWDKHYHVFLLSDFKVRELLSELGLEHEIEWVQTKTGFYTEGKLVSMSNSYEFLKFPPLNLIDKFRLALTIMRASKIKDAQSLEALSVEEWLRKWSGNRTFEKIWLPLLRAKLGENYIHASASFIWAIIARMYAARKSGLKKEMFGYVQGGYQRILSSWSNWLQRHNVDVVYNTQVQEISQTSDGVKILTLDGDTLSFDQVIITANANVASRLIPQLSTKEHNCLQQIRYQGIICASMVLDEPLAKYYVTNITENWVPFTAVIEMSALVDTKEFKGKHLVYLPKYVDPQDPIFERSDESIREEFLSAVARMYPNFRIDTVRAFQISRVRQVFAITTKHYSQNVPPVVTSVPGIHLLNSAHIVNGTLNVNESIQLVDDRLPEILASASVCSEPVGGVV